MIEGQSC